MTKIINAKKKLARASMRPIFGEHRLSKKNDKVIQKPGMHPSAPGSKSEYAKKLREKQIIKRIYNVSEKIIKKYVNIAKNTRGNTTENLANLLERRLDCVVFRSGLAPTIFAAKQLVSHGHVFLNGVKINCPGYNIKNEDVVSIKDSSKNMPLVVNSIASAPSLRKIPEYFDVSQENLSVKIIKNFTHDQIPYDCEVKLSSVVEFYRH
jgi:small subunit ribosomal protein S4